MVVRNLVLVLLFVTVIAPIVLYTDRLGTFKTTSCKFLPLSKQNHSILTLSFLDFL